MDRFSREIQNYDLASNKGYGSAKHIADLKKFGPCRLHRRTFIKRLLTKTI
jgi:ribonuclease HII